MPLPPLGYHGPTPLPGGNPLRAFIIQATLLTLLFMGVLALLRVRWAVAFWHKARVVGYIYVAAVLASAVVHYFVWLR